MTRQINTFTTRAQHNGDLGYFVLDYLAHSFPTQLHEVYSDEDGNLHARPVFDQHGQPVQSREALERRERMIEHLAALPPVHGALDQIVQRFGAEQVAEVTGRVAPDRETTQRGRGPALRRDPAGLRQSRRDSRLPG